MEARASFGYWMRRRRKSLDLTQHELAHHVGTAAGTIQKLEADEQRPSKQLAVRLAELLQIPSAERDAFVKAARAELATDRLAIDDAAPEQPPLRSPDVVTTNLPVPVAPRTFIGRSRELSEVKQLLSSARLLTLTGTGGSAKHGWHLRWRKPWRPRSPMASASSILRHLRTTPW